MRTALAWAAAVLAVIALGVGIEAAAGTSSPVTPSAGAPPLLLRELWNLTETYPGVSPTATREAVGPVGRSTAEQVTMQAGGTDDEPVYVVEFRGHFVCARCSTPPGAGAPTGTVVTLILDASNLLDTDYGLSGRWTSLAPLGSVVTLPHPPAGKAYWPLPTGAAIRSFTGTWSAAGASLSLADLGGVSTMRWAAGRDHLTFVLDEARTGRPGVLSSEASGGVTGNDIGLPEDTRITLVGSPGGIVVTVVPPASVKLPGPFTLQPSAAP